MIKIINNILSSNNYELIELPLQQQMVNIYVFRSSNESNKEEYFVTVQFHEHSDNAAVSLLDEKAQEWFEEISRSGKADQTFEKNCTMILCHEESKIKQQTILMIEEDQYNFKKNIITYNKKELTDLQDYLVQKKIEKITINVINDLINTDNGNQFLKFKQNNKQQKDHYSLFLKIALKLPFVTYTPKEKQLINLIDDIEKSLTKEQLSLYKQLENLDNEWTEKNTEQRVENIWGN